MRGEERPERCPPPEPEVPPRKRSEGREAQRHDGCGISSEEAAPEAKFGSFEEALEEGAIDTIKASGPAALDLLPISVAAVRETTLISDSEVRDWMALSCLCLNFWYCTGWDRPSHTEHPRGLTASQKDFLVMHLLPAVERMLEGSPVLPSLQELETSLSAKGQDYEGNTWVVMEQLQADKVTRCWPEKGKASVQPLVKFLRGETKDQVEVPCRTILPHEDWPDVIQNLMSGHPPKSGKS